jgi:phosphoenolpyruvate carboxylase
LVPDPKLRKKIFNAIEAEWNKTVEALNLVTDEKINGIAAGLRNTR